MPAGLLEIPESLPEPDALIPPEPLTPVQPRTLTSPAQPPRPPPTNTEQCTELQKRRRRRGLCNEGFYRELANGDLEKTPWRTKLC
jgi:hypothetical protein